MMKLATILLMFAALMVVPPVARAQDASSAWNELSDDQRELLAPFEQRWDRIPVERRQDILDGMRRWQAMTPEQREQARRRFDEWNKLPLEQRQAIRERFRNFRALDPQQQREIRERFRDFQNLPPERRRALRERFENRRAPGGIRPPGEGGFPERAPPERPGAPPPG